MIRCLSLSLALGCLAIAGCDDRSTGQTKPREVVPTPTPSPTRSPDAEPQASIMRPSIVADPTPTPAPRPEPVRATILFAEGGNGLNAAAKAELDEIATRISALKGPVILRGHTDSRGNDADNRRVSERRAEAVRDYLSRRGIAPERMTVIALGEDRPAAPNATLNGEDDEAGRQKNRRVEILAEPAALAAKPDPGEAAPAPAPAEAAQK